MERAISNGHYTLEQINLLQAQRQNVVGVANAAIEQYERETNAKANQFLKDASALEGAAAKATAAKAIDSPPLLRMKMFPYCKFRACQACRPTFRERAWERFEDAFDRDGSTFNKAGLQGPRDTKLLASCEIMRTIGLKAVIPPPLPTHRLRRLKPGSVSDSDMRLQGIIGRRDSSSVNGDTRNSPATDGAIPRAQDVADAGLELDSESSRFRDSIMRAFRGVVERSHSSHSTKKRKMASEPKTSADMASWNNSDDALLEEAASVPLPEPEAVDKLVTYFGDTGEVQLGEGVALTEESADLGTADIITSV